MSDFIEDMDMNAAIFFGFFVAWLFGLICVGVSCGIDEGDEDTRRIKKFFESCDFVCGFFCSEAFCGDEYCVRLAERAMRLSERIEKNNLFGLSDFNSSVRDCVKAYCQNCEQICQLQLKVGSHNYSNEKEMCECIESLKSENVAIVKIIESFDTKVSELIVMAKEAAEEVTKTAIDLSAISVNGTKQKTELQLRIDAIDRAISEFERIPTGHPH